MFNCFPDLLEPNSIYRPSFPFSNTLHHSKIIVFNEISSPKQNLMQYNFSITVNIVNNRRYKIILHAKQSIKHPRAFLCKQKQAMTYEFLLDSDVSSTNLRKKDNYS